MQDEELRSKIRDVLVNLRTEHELSQTEVGKIVGKSKTAVASWEQGLSLPDLVTLKRLAIYYNKTMDYMFGDNKE